MRSSSVIFRTSRFPRSTLTAFALLVAISTIGGPGAVSAQTAWEAPPLISPAVPSGASLFLVNPHGGDLGGLITYRHAAGPVGMGYRFAMTDQNGGDGLAVSGGIDFSGFLSRAVEGSEVDVMWWSGIGAGFGEETVVSFPLGAIIGWTGRGGDVVLSPYGGGHVTLDVTTIDSDNVTLGGSFDIGADLSLSNGWLVRFGATFGDREALAIGARIGA